MSKRQLISNLKILIIIGLVFFGCKKNPTKSTPTQEVVISNSVVVLPDSTMKKLDHTDSTTYYFSNSAKSLLNLQPGNIIVNGMGNGTLRKVKSVSETNNFIAVATEGARLDEVILKGGFSIDTTLSSEKLQDVRLLKGIIFKPDGNRFYVAFDTVIWTDPETGGEIRIDGNVTFSARVKLGVKYDNGLDTLGFVVTTAKTESLSVIASKSVNLLDKQITVATFPYPLPPILVAGVLPVEIVANLQIVLGANASLQGAVATGVTFADTITGGIQYKYGTWTPQFSYEKQFGFKAPELSAGGDVKGYALVPKVEVFVYDVLGPTASFEGYLRCHADPFSSPWWALYAGMAAQAGVEFDILGLFTAGYQATLFEHEWELGHAPTDSAPAPPILSSPADGATNVSTNPTFSWNASGGATSYTLQVSIDSSFSSFVVNQNALTSTSYPVNGLSNSTTYYWRVSASNSYGTLGWSWVWHFTTEKIVYVTVELQNDDGSAERVISLVNLYDNGTKCAGSPIWLAKWLGVGLEWSWGNFTSLTPAPDVVPDGQYGFSATLIPSAYPFKLEKVKMYFYDNAPLGDSFYLHVWDEQNNDLLPSPFSISSQEIKAPGWWEKDIEDFHVIVNSGKIQVGICQKNIPHYDVAVDWFPTLKVYLGGDIDATGNSNVVHGGLFLKERNMNYMIRAEGTCPGQKNLSDYSQYIK
jgi:hypothetical protein